MPHTARLALALSVLLAACSSVPQGQRVAATEDVALKSARVAVLDASASIGTLTSGGDFVPDEEASARLGPAIQAALTDALRDRGIAADVRVLNGSPLPPEAVVVVEDLYDAVLEEGFAAPDAAMSAFEPRFPLAIAAVIDADYAMVPLVSGAYSSGGRRLSQAAGAVLAVGAGIGYLQSGGGQYAVVGLYDVAEDELVWVHKDAFSKPSLRDEGAMETLADRLLAPLGHGD